MLIAICLLAEEAAEEAAEAEAAGAAGAAQIFSTI